MAKWKVEVSDEFLKQLDDIPEEIRKEIGEVIKGLANSKDPTKFPGAKKLSKREKEAIVKKHPELFSDDDS